MLLFMNSAYAQPKTCLWVSSYAPGYAWNDGIGQGIHQQLDNVCDLHEFHMNTKQIKTPEHAQAMALKAKALIEDLKPDVVIASDDNAVKYLVEPYYKDAELPIVVCGINWSPEKYGFPYKNVTGIIEVMPVLPLIRNLQEQYKLFSGTAILLTGDTNTSKINYEPMQKIFARYNIELISKRAANFSEWKIAIDEGQEADSIILLNNSGIKHWNDADALEYLKQHNKRLTVTFNSWMRPFAMLAYTKISTEQGEWAGKMARAILKDHKPVDIPMVSNQKWNEYINSELFKLAGIKTPFGIYLDNTWQ